jgi:hypothetical protein
MTQGASASLRLTATTIVVLWELTVAFVLLSAVRFFTRPVALAGFCVAAALAQRGVRPMTQVREDLAAVRRWWSATNGAFRSLIIVGAGIAFVRFVHGLLAPSLTWDGLTYHLYKAAVWVQSQTLASTAGPDAAGYYAWFPPYGDAIWAWGFLALHRDAANAPIAAAASIMIPLAIYACARTLEVPSIRATAASVAVAFTPAVMNFAAAVYVDNLVVALFVAGTAFLARTFTGGRTADAVLSAAAFAVLAGVKGSVLPICVIGIACAFAFTRSGPGKLLVAVTAVPAVVPSLLAWRATGSPLYPLTVRLGNHVLFAGNLELEWLLRGEWLSPGAIEDARANLASRLFLPWDRPDGDFLNLGLGPLFLVPGLIPGLLTLWRSRTSRYVTAFVVVAACLTLAAVAGQDSAALRLWWWGVLGRLVTIAVAAAALIAAAWPTTLSTVMLWLCAASGLTAAWPHGVSFVDARAAMAASLPLVVTAGTAWIAGLWLPRVRMPLRWTAAIIMVAVLIVVRDRFRYEYYTAAAALQAYDTHPLDPDWTASWPVWQRLDGADPKVVAASAGWEGIGHNWYRFPLVGGRLQNRVLYIPITRDGQLVDYGLDVSPILMSCDAWLERMLASPAEYFVVLPPMPPEARWARALPDVFVPDFEVRSGGAVLYRIARRQGRSPSCGAAGAPLP